jgi:hypothetical protein
MQFISTMANGAIHEERDYANAKITFKAAKSVSGAAGVEGDV